MKGVKVINAFEKRWERKYFILIATDKEVSSEGLIIGFWDTFFHLFCSTYDNSVTISSYWLKIIGKPWERSLYMFDSSVEITSYDFEFDNWYGWIFKEGYGKTNEEEINDRLRYVDS